MSSFPSRGKGTSPQFAVLWGGMWSPLPPGELESLSGARRGVGGPSFTALRDHVDNQMTTVLTEELA